MFHLQFNSAELYWVFDLLCGCVGCLLRSPCLSIEHCRMLEGRKAWKAMGHAISTIVVTAVSHHVGNMQRATMQVLVGIMMNYDESWWIMHMEPMELCRWWFWWRLRLHRNGWLSLAPLPRCARWPCWINFHRHCLDGSQACLPPSSTIKYWIILSEVSCHFVNDNAWQCHTPLKCHRGLKYGVLLWWFLPVWPQQ